MIQESKSSRLQTQMAKDWFAPGSGIIIDPGTDYYLAGTFDLPQKTITYYAFDLDENSLQRTTVPHTMSTLHLDSTIRIGDAECGCTLDGLIDEVRLSE